MTLRERVWPNRHITFTEAKSLIYSLILSVYVGGGGELKTSYGGKESKIAQKTVIYMNVPLTANRYPGNPALVTGYVCNAG